RRRGVEEARAVRALDVLVVLVRRPLRVARAAVLVTPRRVFLADETELAERLPVAGRVRGVLCGQRLVCALALRQGIEELGQRRRDQAADSAEAERIERNDEGVELALPVD